MRVRSEGVTSSPLRREWGSGRAQDGDLVRPVRPVRLLLAAGLQQQLLLSESGPGEGVGSSDRGLLLTSKEPILQEDGKKTSSFSEEEGDLKAGSSALHCCWSSPCG